MKKLLAIIGTALCVLFMGGCAEVCVALSFLSCDLAIAKACTEPYPFIHETENFDEVRIELVMVGSEPNEETGTYSMTATTVKEISEEEKQAFLEEFMQLEFIYPYGPPIDGISSGQAFCFTYPDGQVEVATDWGSGLYTDRTLEEHIGSNYRTSPDEPFLALWDKWAQS